MKNQISFQLTFEQTIGLDIWMSERLIHFRNGSSSEKCVGALLAYWQLKTLKPKTFLRTFKPLKFTIEEPLVHAFAHFLEVFEPNEDDLGWALVKLYGQIHKTTINA